MSIATFKPPGVSKVDMPLPTRILLMHSFDGAAGEVNNVVPQYGKPGVLMHYVNRDGNGFAQYSSQGVVQIVGMGVIPAGYARRIKAWWKVDLNIGAVDQWGVGFRALVPLVWNSTYFDSYIYKQYSFAWNCRQGYYNGSGYSPQTGGGWESQFGAGGVGILHNWLELDPNTTTFRSGWSFRLPTGEEDAYFYSGVESTGGTWNNVVGDWRVQWFENGTFGWKLRSLMVEDVLSR